MKKQGKVGILFLLKKTAKDQSPLLGASRPRNLYVQVNYLGKNTQFRSMYNDSYHTKAEIYGEQEDKRKRKTEENLIRTVVEHEVNILGTSFSLSGLSERIFEYREYLQNKIDSYYIQILYDAVLKSGSEFIEFLDPYQLSRISFITYYKAANRLIDGLENMLPKDFKVETEMLSLVSEWLRMQKLEIMVIDWLTESTKEGFIAFLKKNNHSSDYISLTISLVDRILKLSKNIAI